MTLSLRARIESLLKHFPAHAILDALADVLRKRAQLCGDTGKGCRCPDVQGMVYHQSSRWHHEARCASRAAADMRMFDLEKPAGRSGG